MRVKVKINGSGVRAAGRSEGVYRELERRADRVIAFAKSIAAPHYKTGDYNDSFRKVRTRIRGKAAVEVVNISDHALILEKGSPPHVIEPKNKKALSWPGAAHPVGRVNHPGTQAYNILRRALRAAGR